MLSVVHPQTQDLHHHQHHHQPLPFRPMPHRVDPEQPAEPMKAPGASDASVIQALEVARESPDGLQDPTVSKILEAALSSIWSKVQAQPDSYVMSRDEFAIFNFFQHRFTDNSTARLARKRYWSNVSG